MPGRYHACPRAQTSADNSVAPAGSVLSLSSVARVKFASIALMVVLASTGLSATRADLARARSLYNQRQFDGAIEAATLAQKTPATMDAATVVLARAHLERYRELLVNQGSNSLRLQNENFDIGQPTAAGKYPGADAAYDHLLEKLADHKFEKMSPELRANLLAYYGDRKAPEPTRNKKVTAQWKEVSSRVELLRAGKP